MIEISPSILASDFSRLGEVVAEIGQNGCDMVHIDIMDGHFVPNITMGPMIVKAIRPAAETFFDVHLMISEPEKYIPAYMDAGADGITFHVEAVREQAKAELSVNGQVPSDAEAAALTDLKMHALIEMIHLRGKKAAVAINPNTPVSAVENVLGEIDMLLIMTVYPGFGGQKFITDTLEKMAEARSRCPHLRIQVDGGVSPDNMKVVTAHGADVLVMGTAYFKAPDKKALVESVHHCAD